MGNLLKCFTQQSDINNLIDKEGDDFGLKSFCPDWEVFKKKTQTV